MGTMARRGKGRGRIEGGPAVGSCVTTTVTSQNIKTKIFPSKK